MNGSVVYLDSSAIVKLVIREAESEELWAFLESRPQRVSSVIARVEVLRALRRAGIAGAAFRRAQQILDRLALIRLDAAVVETAASANPASLRTLDAIHLATALSIRPDLSAMITYDARLKEAAMAAQIPVISPGRRLTQG